MGGNQLVTVEAGESLPSLIDRAAQTLVGAKSSAEVLEARDLAGTAYTAAKRAARLAHAKKATDDVIARVYRTQADALLIESRAKERLADEYDAAQERGEVQRHGGQKPRDVAEPNIPSAADLGLRRDEIHEARLIRDAEKAELKRSSPVVAADLTFSVPGEVRGKGRPRIGMIGGRKNPASGRREGGLARMIPDKKTVDYEARLRNAARVAMERAGYHESDFDGPLSVILRARFTPAASTPKKRLAEMLLDRLRPTKKPDMDNIVKLLDALQRKRFKRKDGSFDIEPCVFPDDSAVVELTAFKVYAEEPGLDIRIIAWEPETPDEPTPEQPSLLT